MKIRIALAAAGLAVAATILAPTAHADESSYLNELSNAGFYGPIQHWLQIGYTVCSMSASGANIGQETTFVYNNTNNSVGYAASERVVELASIFLC
jgi:hypothetical protein